MDPVQVYETTIFNRDRAGEGFHFVSVPPRSFPGGEVPPTPQVARAFRLLDTVTRYRERDGRAEPWMLPFIIDGALGNDAARPSRARLSPVRRPVPMRPRRREQSRRAAATTHAWP
jgi:hypothetical protein